MRRFYETVEVRASEDGAFRVCLDGRSLRTPGKHVLTLPTIELAHALADEWSAQDEIIVPARMPHTRLASTVVDRMPGLRPAAIDEIVAYAGSDLLCFRAADPLPLVSRQRQVWQPLLDWAAERFGLRFEITAGLLPIGQPPSLASSVRREAEAGTDWYVVGLHAATTLLGSIVLGLALRDDRVSTEEAFDAALLDELFELERWGIDDQTERRHLGLRRDLRAAVATMAAGRPW